MLPANQIVSLLLDFCVAFRTWLISSGTHTAVPERAACTPLLARIIISLHINFYLVKNIQVKRVISQIGTDRK